MQGDAPQYLPVRQFTIHQSPTSRPDKDFGLPLRTTSVLLLSDCRRHFSTFSVHFAKTFKTASLFTLLSWPCLL